MSSYSPLRQLAKDYSQGKIDQHTYRQQRTILLDGLVSGAIPLVRPAAESAAQTPPHEATVEFPAAAPGSKPGYSLTTLLAAGVILLALLVWALLPSAPPPAEETSPAPEASDATPVVAQDPAIGELRALVEGFLQRADWNQGSVEDLGREWRRFAPDVRAQARDRVWFRRLTDGLTVQIDQQQALAELAPSPSVQANLRALRKLVVDLRDQGPREPTAPAADRQDQSPASAATPGSASSTPAPAMPEPDPAAAPRETSAGAAYTIQLYAFSEAGNARKLIDGHPELALKEVDTGQPDSRYRVVYGAFQYPWMAARAYNQLPAQLRENSAGPNIKRFDELTAAVAGPPLETSQEPARPGESVNDNAWVAAQPRGRYTLQLFAMNNPENVHKLVTQHPELRLKVLVAADARSRYRILYGLFETPQSAERAHQRMPFGIASESRQPNIKTLGELQDIALP